MFFIHLDAWNNALVLNQIFKRGAINCLLGYRLVAEDDSADVLRSTLCSEEHLSVVAPAVFSILNVDRGETPFNRRGALVGR